MTRSLSHQHVLRQEPGLGQDRGPVAGLERAQHLEDPLGRPGDAEDVLQPVLVALQPGLRLRVGDVVLLPVRLVEKSLYELPALGGVLGQLQAAVRHAEPDLLGCRGVRVRAHTQLLGLMVVTWVRPTAGRSTL